MHLRSLTLRGFKSFASSTTIDLEPGITCVVGPNGSGKSNVVDAIAWVMGEQGAKSLRGGKMEDVIFAGTSGKAPLGRAEVELTIDNSDGALPIEYSEVTIRRTLFRSGGSEYAINGQTCRLLDVQELLADSGIGREMHVIVGQGRLDAILHASPEDRRGFIEEAAGVLKHRRRKEKALRKLEQIQQNLNRLTDLAAELRRQLKPLGRQAEVARRAATIQADVRDARLRLLADDVAGVQRDLAQEQADESAAKAERQRVEEQLASARAKEAEVESRLQEISPRLHQTRTRSMDLTRLRERMNALVGLIEERRRSLEREQLEFSFGVDPEDLQRQADAVADEVRDNEDVLAAAQAAYERARDAAEAAGGQVRAEQERVGAAQQALTEHRQAVAAAEQAVAGGQRLVDATQSRLERLVQQHEHAALEAQEAAREAETLPALDTVDITVDATAADKAMQETERAVELARAELSSQEQRRASLTARCEALRSAVTTDGETTLDGSMQHGSLDSLIRVRPGYEKAVAVLLGVHARAAVLREDVSAQNALGALGVDESARFVLGGTAHGVDSEVLGYIEAPEFLRGALGAILQDCRIVQSLEQAQVIADQDPHALIATPDGQVVGRGTAGQGSEAGNVIALRNALEQATEDLVATEACWQRAVDHLARVEAQAARAREHRDEVRAEAAQQQAVAAAAAERDVHVRQAAAATARRLQQIAGERDEVAAALEAQSADLASARTLLGELTAAGVPTVDRTALDELLAAQERARHTHHEASLSARSAQERHRALLARHAELQEQTRQAHQAVEAAARRRIEREQALVTLGRLDALARRSAALVDGDARASEQRLTQMEAEQATLQEEHSAARTAALELAAEVDRLTLDVHRDEVLRAGKRATLEQLTEKALEEYGLTIDDLVAEYGPEQLIPGVEGEEPHAFDREVQQRRLKEAERGLALLGRVNPLALEEFAAMEERHTHLVNQIEDVKKSREDLLDIVADVDARVLQVFSEAYADVAREFEYTFAKLFPGGQGRLVLTEPDDLLNTGVEVEARPPGKKIKRLSLLSGGERSLTAVAFLVALFKARPSPFYLLDEVEAALDDVNLGRLIGLLEELRQTSQLLVITHQKRTMEMADALYGVTMRAGVTEVISQRMRQLQPV
ncbi:MAG: chromosome segregation protein SMC [Actinobacteria bacterium]|nr:chromosome segregation protein SMC [Actinomycetota bacterium]HRY11054.1 chromosome segregation protein SMC [Candidatus Nanopelagicales bacterium]